ncbi:MAG: hypothetical protein AAFX87_16875 [Bacteroidota bacterium]
MKYYPKDTSDYALLLAGYGINFLPFILVPLSMGASSVATIIVGTGCGLTLSYFTNKLWEKMFIVYAIETGWDTDWNFKICHEVVKSFSYKMVNNDYDRRRLQARIRNKHPNYPRTTIILYAQDNEILFNLQPGLNIGFYLFLSIHETEIKKLIEEIASNPSKIEQQQD